MLFSFTEGESYQIGWQHDQRNWDECFSTVWLFITTQSIKQLSASIRKWCLQHSVSNLCLVSQTEQYKKGWEGSIWKHKSEIPSDRQLLWMLFASTRSSLHCVNSLACILSILTAHFSIEIYVLHQFFLDTVPQYWISLLAKKIIYHGLGGDRSIWNPCCKCKCHRFNFYISIYCCLCCWLCVCGNLHFLWHLMEVQHLVFHVKCWLPVLFCQLTFSPQPFYLLKIYYCEISIWYIFQRNKLCSIIYTCYLYINSCFHNRGNGGNVGIDWLPSNSLVFAIHWPCQFHCNSSSHLDNIPLAIFCSCFYCLCLLFNDRGDPNHSTGCFRLNGEKDIKCIPLPSNFHCNWFKYFVLDSQWHCVSCFFV